MLLENLSTIIFIQIALSLATIMLDVLLTSQSDLVDLEIKNGQTKLTILFMRNQQNLEILSESQAHYSRPNTDDNVRIIAANWFPTGLINCGDVSHLNIEVL